jgi:hypothetical protein
MAADPRVDTLLDSHIQAPWYKSPVKAGLAKG